MNLNIIPQKMEGGMITAIQVTTDGKEEIFTIPPAPFETFEGIKAVIMKYYEIADLWNKAKQEYTDIRQRFDLIDFRHTAAYTDFKLLISPKIEPKPIIKIPVEVSAPTRIFAPGEPYGIMAHSISEPSKLLIVPPETPAETVQQAPISMHERAEKAGEELKNATVIIDQPKTELVQEPQVNQESQMVILMREHPTLLTSEVKDMLPDKAKGVLEDMQKRIETGRAAADMSIPLQEPPKKPVSVQDWVKEVDKTVTDRLENTEFKEETLEEELLKCGVPEKLLEKVKNQLIESWETANRFEKKEEDSFFLKLKNLSQKVIGGRKKKPKV